MPGDPNKLLQRMRLDFMGLDREDLVVGGELRRRVYLDTTATALMPRLVWNGLSEYLSASCANSHTLAHRAGRDTTRAIDESRDAIGRLVGYRPGHDVVLFTGNGATGAINFLARALFPPELRPLVKRFPEGTPPALIETFSQALGSGGSAAIKELMQRPLVVTTEMEHHSNLLPWIEAVGHHNIRAVEIDRSTGGLRLDHLKSILEEEGDRVRLLAVTGVSNVTGIINDVHALARLAHQVGAQILVDGAQWVPHEAVQMHPNESASGSDLASSASKSNAGSTEGAEALDYLVLSGHKLYAPGSRGALIGNLQTLSGRRCVTDVGGGMVEYVAIQDFELKEEVTAREEAGTPNIPGTIAMGLIASALLEVGMERIAKAEAVLTRRLLRRVVGIEGVEVYGSTDLKAVPRAGVVTFNVQGLHHAQVAHYLNDFHNIAVRNECFCAHPYVKCLLGVDASTESRYRDEMHHHDRRHVPGGVRASLGLYSTEADVEALGQALETLVENRDAIAARYTVSLDGSCPLDGAEDPSPTTFALTSALDSWRSRLMKS